MHRQSETGAALVFTMIMIFIVSASATTLLSISFSGMKREQSRDLKFKSRQVAEAGLDISLNALRLATDDFDNDGDASIDEGIYEDDPFDPATVATLEGNLGRIGTLNWTIGDDNNGNGLPDFDEPNVVPDDLSGGEFISYSIFSEADGLDNDGDGTVDEDDEAGSVSMFIQGRIQDYISRIRYTGILTDFRIPPDAPEYSPNKAFIVGEDLKAGGDILVSGSQGHIHSNNYMEITGSAKVVGDATASNGGNIDPGSVGGVVDTSAPLLNLPYINRSFMQGMLTQAMAAGKDVYTFNSDGSVSQNSVIISTGGSYKGWKMVGQTWKLNGSQGCPDGIIYSPLNVDILGGKEGVSISVFSEGNICLGGNGNFSSYYNDIFLVSLLDIQLSGTPQTSGDLGAIFAREQIECLGNTFIRGVVLAGDWDNASDFVTENKINGNFGIEYNGGFNTGLPIIDPNDNKYKYDPTFSAYEEL